MTKNLYACIFIALLNSMHLYSCLPCYRRSRIVTTSRALDDPFSGQEKEKPAPKARDITKRIKQDKEIMRPSQQLNNLGEAHDEVVFGSSKSEENESITKSSARRREQSAKALTAAQSNALKLNLSIQKHHPELNNPNIEF